MLKYRLTMRPAINRDVCMRINQVEIDDSAYRMFIEDENPDEDGVVARSKDVVTVRITSTPDVVGAMSIGMMVGVAHTYSQDGGTQDQPTEWEKMEYITVRGFNKNDNTFSFQIPFFIRLDVEKAYKMIDVNGVWGEPDQTYLLVYFPETHLFCSNDSTQKLNDDILCLRLTVGENTEVVDWEDKFYDGNSRLLLPWNDAYEMMVPESLADGRLTTPLDLTYLHIERSNPDFRTNDSYRFFKDMAVGVIPVPISNMESAEGNKEVLLNERFVDDVRKRTVNPHIDMERDVYHPVWYKDGNAEMIYDMVFNFHFRQHRGDNWLVENDTMWNGSYHDDDGKWKMMDDSSKEENAFFSNIDYSSRQSDLLTYLGFNNNDVKFQKNRLSKSFIRLLFYDSPNSAKQNLLYTSTIYLNSNELFGKYVRYAETEPYSHVNDDGEVTLNLSGIDVGREPYGNGLHGDETEAMRLSSQIHLKDKLSSDGSSDGFYLYLWKEYDMGTEPQDLYLKVEFNHAGYGRTIPFMMPYLDKDKHGSAEGRIKSFEEILNDFNGTGDDKPYGIRQYQKYSYIHLKYRYDNSLDRHVFYLDPDIYGKPTSGCALGYSTNKIYFNLYEAKLVTDGVLE